jgi:hypothetical protein
MNQFDVVQIFRNEREYQDKRWGYRRRDGGFDPAPHSVVDFVMYMDDYLTEARHIVSRTPSAEAVDAIKKVAVLAVACWEQHVDKSVLSQLETVCLPTVQGSVEEFILNIDHKIRVLKDAFVGFYPANLNFNNKVALKNIIALGMVCCMQYGVDPRPTSPSGVVINGRDGKVA